MASCEDEMIREDKSVDDIYERDALPFARGISGKVYRGRHRESGQQVAIKEIDFSASAHARQLRLRKEAEAEITMLLRIKTRVSNPCVMQLLEAFLDDRRHRFYLVMPMYSGGELFDYVAAATSFCEKIAATITRKLATALRDLHAAGVIHRDIKPENILLHDKNDPTNIVLTDFGLAKCRELVDLHDRKVVGTQSYIAPELYKGEAATEQVDVWSMGVCLYILLSGIAPFYGPHMNPRNWQERAENKATIKASTTGGRFYFFEEYFGQVSDDAKDLIRRCLTVDPEQRATIADVLNHPFLTRQQSVEPLPTTELARFNARRKFRAAIRVGLLTAKLNIKQAVHMDSTLAGLGREEVSLLRTAFVRVARKHGAVTKEQFCTVMQVLGFAAQPVDQMFRVFDADGNGTVDYKEILAGVSCLKASNVDSLRMLFTIYDEDDSGTISRTEFAHVLAICNPDAVSSYEGIERAVDLFERVDTDGDNEICIDEFMAGVRHYPVLAQQFVGPLHPKLGVSLPSDAAVQWELDRPSPSAATPTLQRIAKTPRPSEASQTQEAVTRASSDVEDEGAGAGTGAGAGAGAGAGSTSADTGSGMDLGSSRQMIDLADSVRRRKAAGQGPEQAPKAPREQSQVPDARASPAEQAAPPADVVDATKLFGGRPANKTGSWWTSGAFFVLGVAVSVVALKWMQSSSN